MSLGGYILAGKWKLILRNVWWRLTARLRGLDVSPIPAADLHLPEGGVDYADSGGPDLAIVLKDLNLPRSTWALDVGCGKGGSLVTLASFMHAEGLEYAAELIPVAYENLRHGGGIFGRVLQGDAATFTNLDSYTLFYLFNPFSDVTLSAFLRNVEASRLRHPRKLSLLYRNAQPEHTRAMKAAGWIPVRSWSHAPHPIVLWVPE